MNMTPTHTSGHLLLFRGTDWHRDLSPDEIQNIMTRWNSWFEGLKNQGKVLAGSPLENEGRVVVGKAGGVADGPFAESKEAIGGYFLLEVANLEEAVAIARNCPALPHGLTVEVRPLAPACPVNRMLEEVSVAATV